MIVRIATAATVALAASAHAGLEYSEIGPSVNPAEKTHDEILSDIFGGTFVPDGDVDFSNGMITANRLADNGNDGIVDLVFGDSDTAEDQIWGDGDGITLTAEAKFAGDSSTFGWIDGAGPGGDFNPLLDTSMIGESVDVALTPEFRWALDDATFGNLVTSNPEDQTLFDAPVDHMVAYHITGLDSDLNTWVLFFEDRVGGDYDYQDAVVQISAIPAPGALALLGVGGLVAARRRR